jgi:hypothetical protein
MKARRILWGVALACAAFACGDRLIRDPSFELWCGKKLCAPWESHGKVTRVGTWHRHDYGVELADGAEISQLVNHAPVKCIEFELIADVSAEAEVQLELDFMDDGHVEHAEPIAESHWARLHFLVRAPSWYDGVRFTVRKQGHGHAVLAQLAASASSDCSGEPIVLDDLLGGAHCENDDQCASGLCDAIPQRTMLDGEPPPDPALVCSGCSVDDECGGNQVCGVLESQWGPYRDCVGAGSTELGAFCEDASQCASGLCLHGLAFHNATCAGCEHDTDCDAGELCGLEVMSGGATRVCEAESALALGELCGENAQCASGVCCFGACSECCGEWLPCEDGSACGSTQIFAASATQLCGVGDPREAGAACGSSIDCESGRCDQPALQCLLEGNAKSSDLFEAVCRVAQQIAGVCR